MSYPRPPIDLGFTDMQVPCGSHICYIYTNDDERLRLLAAYLKAGRERGEESLFITESIEPHDLGERLTDEGFDPDGKPACDLRHARDAYYGGGVFEPDEMLDALANNYVEAREAGSVGHRCTGDTSWLTRQIPGAERMLEYEAKLTPVLDEYPTTAVCQYDARLFSGEFLAEVIQLHPYLVVEGQLVENPYFVEPEEYLEHQNQPRPCHERRV